MSEKRGPGAAGLVLEGKYRLLEEIGTGAMGTVFRAWDESLDRAVAVKFLRPELEARQDLVARFQREARAMASISHENVTAINALGRHGPSHFFVMEYIEGESADLLLEAARRAGRLPPLATALDIVAQTCAGLDAVHGAGVVHRDIKPGNIIVDVASGRVAITDFGLGRLYRPGERPGARGVGGTPGYLAPEIIAEQTITREEDHLTDIYALGATAFELLTGDLPFPEDSVVLVLQAHLAKQPPAPSSRRPEIPAALDEIVLKCLEKDPAKRLPSCAEIRSALASVVLPPPERRRPPSPEPPPVGPGEAKRRTTAARAVDPVRVLVSHRSGSVRERLAHAVRDAIPSCRIWSATDNVEALRLARAHAPLLAVVDGEDTEMSGLELATELRADPHLGSIRLVVVAPRASDRDRRTLEDLGVRLVLGDTAASEALRDGLRSVLKPQKTPYDNLRRRR